MKGLQSLSETFDANTAIKHCVLVLIRHNIVIRYPLRENEYFSKL